MKLTVHLLRPDLRSSEQALLTKHRGKKFKEVPATDAALAGMSAWVQVPSKKRPRWATFLEQGFELPRDLINQSNGFILVVKDRKRFFAITFGYGLTALDPAMIEPDFGLRIVLNTTEAGKLTTLDTRRLDKATKQTRTHLNSAQELSEFGILPTVDWLRSARGKISTGTFKGTISGADSVQVSFDGEFQSLKSACRELLEFYERTDYRARFAFIVQLRAIRSKDPIVQQLDDAVTARIIRRDPSDFNFAHPEIPEVSIQEYELSFGRESQRVEEVSFESAFAFVDECSDSGRSPSFKDIKVIGLDDQNEARTRQQPLWSYLIAHIELDGALYVLSLGHWYKIDKSYVDQLRREVKALPDLTVVLDLPAWKGCGEGTYNKLAAQQKMWCLVDRALIKIRGQAGSKVECADLISRDGHFIHVKSLQKSATMSHLFSQASVSAELYRSEPEYTTQVCEITVKPSGKQWTRKSLFWVSALPRRGRWSTRCSFSRL